MGQCSFPPCRHPYAERRSEEPQSALATRGLPPQNTESAPLLALTSASVRGLLSTLQCSLHATARRVACPPGRVRPRAQLRPPRTFTPELARGRSPGSRVGYDYTALLGEDCDRTSTGWSTAVTGCTFCRKLCNRSVDCARKIPTCSSSAPTLLFTLWAAEKHKASDKSEQVLIGVLTRSWEK